jgi:hypothetical protein
LDLVADDRGVGVRRLGLLGGTPAAAPVAEEPLLPMRSARGKGFENGCGQEKQLQQSARRKTVAAE